MPWSPNLAIGVKQIDDQHKMWFEKADALFEAGKNRREKEYIGEMLKFLDEYTKKHFSDEEKYMSEIGYPGLAEQKKAHADFVARLDKLRAEYEKSGGSISVILGANTMVIDWLTNHIAKMDRKIGEFTGSLK
ncbi:MAG TPA: hemerythrin family protein [Bacillota bacterium]|nr:hemerythrin family protein [Clostridiales bacterium]HPT85943.1 hemerythrin family protein [Bacillota bacterium]